MAKCTTTMTSDFIEVLSTAIIDSNDPSSSDVNITCSEIQLENDAEMKTCYIEVIHNEDDCSSNFVIPQHTNIPRKLFLEQDMLLPDVIDSVHYFYFEVTNDSILTDPLTSNFRPPKDKLVAYINELKSREICGIKYGINLGYGKFDLEGLKVFEEYQLKDDVINESIWFDQKDFATPKCAREIDTETTREFHQWLLNFGSEDKVPLQGTFELKTHEIADLACERWINDYIISSFVNLILVNNQLTYVIKFSLALDLDSEVHHIRQRFSNSLSNGQIIFISHIGIHPDSDETFMSQEHLHTSHYAFASFLFCDGKVRYADTMGLKIPSEFIEKVNFILSNFDVEPSYHYCHDPRGTVIEDEPRFISHICTQYCSKIYPLQTCTNICGVALLIGMCIASSSRGDFIEMCKTGKQCSSKFSYLRNISHYSHFLRLVLIQYLLRFCIDLQVITDIRHGTEHADKTVVSFTSHKSSIGQLAQFRRKNILDIKHVSDIIQDAVLKYAKSKDKPVMQLICRIKSTGKLVTKSFSCSSLGQDDKECVASIQNFLNTPDCRDWLSSYVSEVSTDPESIKLCNLERISEGIAGSLTSESQSNTCTSLLTECTDNEPVKRNRRKNHLDISYVSDLICDAKLKFVKIKGKPALQLGCIIRANGKSVTKSFFCSSLGQDDSECVAKIQKFIDSDDCVEWLSSYIKFLENQIGEGEDNCGSMKLSYRKNVLDIRKISHLVSDARVRFIKSKGRPFIQLMCKVKVSDRLISKIFPHTSEDQSEVHSVEVVQKFINSSSCETWLLSSVSKNLLDISNISHLVDVARLKYFRVKGNPVVQLLCQMKSTKKLVKKTFAFSASGIGDSESIAEIQKYIESASCISWLNKCKNRISSSSMPLDISNISDLVDDAKLKFHIVSHKPVMQLTCHLMSNQKSVSRVFPCSSLGYKDTDCIGKIQEFVKSIDCVAWLYKHIMKNSPSEPKYEQLELDLKNSGEHFYPVHGVEIEPTTTIKVELDPDGEMVESWIDSDQCGSSSDESVDRDPTNLACDQSFLMELFSHEESSLKLEDKSSWSKHLNLRNVADFVEDVVFKVVEVNGKVKVCLLFRIRYTQKLLKRYIPCSGVTKDPDKLLAVAQSFLNSKKCVKWLSRSVKDFYGKGALDIHNISDLVDYVWLKYTKQKDEPVVYLGCRIASSKKSVRKIFQCTIFKECVKEIQNFVDSSSCRTWLEVYSRKLGSEISGFENLQNRNEYGETMEFIENSDNLSDMEITLTLVDSSDLNKEGISDFVTDVKIRFLDVKNKPMLQLVCQLKHTQKLVTKCFPCSSLGLKDTVCITSIQTFLNTEECVNWLMEATENSSPCVSESLRNVYNIKNEIDVHSESHRNLDTCFVELQKSQPVIANYDVRGAISSDNSLDVGNICDLIQSAKLLFVNVKHKPQIQLLCQIKSTGKLVTKSFSCSSFGLHDKACLAVIQNFISSRDCVMWLEKCSNENLSGDLQDEPSPLSVKPSQVDVVGKPEINFVKPNTLRLVCRLKNGRTKCKVFRCSSEGKNDKVAMKVIDDFINGDAFDKWFLNDNGNQPDGEWKFLKYLNTGVDTRDFVESIPFDLNQNFSLNKREKYKVAIHRNQGCSKSIAENSSWKVTHRLDDTYSLSGEPPNKGFVAVYLILNCASKTDECRTECGVPIKNVNIVGNSLSCCGHVLKGYHCTNCLTNTTPQWCRKKNNVVLCKNCDVYLRMHGTDRPKNLWKESSAANFKHLKCKWKLKFVLRTENMSQWHVYKSVHNHENHNSVIQERKRPGLVTKDEWCLSKVKKSSNPKKQHSTKKQNKKKPPEVSSSYVQSEFQDSDVSLCKTSEELKQELYQVECPDDSTQYIEACENYVHDAGVINSEEMDISKTAAFPCDEEEVNSSLPLRKKFKMERTDDHGEGYQGKEGASMVCIKCIQKNSQEVFCCSKKNDLDDHITKCHREELFACAPCYTENNVIVTFHDESSFKDHMKLHALKKVF